VIHALALIAAVVSTAALLLVVSLTVFVASLALRAGRTRESRRDTRHLEVSMVGEPQADPVRFPERGNRRQDQRAASESR
jgi:hypothetical protein